jgi:glycosyltransferase involved in cell wall biosynthesis
VPVGNAKALAEAIASTLDEPVDLEARRLRADEFSLEKSVAQYRQVLRVD